MNAPGTPRKHKALFTGAAGAGLLLLLALVGVGIWRYQRQSPQWTEIIPESYWVIGPFGPGMHRAYEPEQHAEPTQTCKTPAGEELHWDLKSVIPRVKCLDFRKAFKQDTKDSVGYALVYIHSSTAGAGEMLVGSDDTITVWVNGQQIHQNAKLRPGVPDEDRAPVAWEQGWNKVLIKVGNGTGDHLFFAKCRGESALRASTSMDLR
jgi:hypothetical protein